MSKTIQVSSVILPLTTEKKAGNAVKKLITKDIKTFGLPIMLMVMVRKRKSSNSSYEMELPGWRQPQAP